MGIGICTRENFRNICVVVSLQLIFLMLNMWLFPKGAFCFNQWLCIFSNALPSFVYLLTIPVPRHWVLCLGENQNEREREREGWVMCLLYTGRVCMYALIPVIKKLLWVQFATSYNNNFIRAVSFFSMHVWYECWNIPVLYGFSPFRVSN